MRGRSVSPNKPEFLCGHCQDVLCTDCASIAAEYEFLHEKRKLELMRAQDKLNSALQEIDQLKKQVERWQQAAKIGYPEIIKRWLDYEIDKKGGEA